MLSIAMAATARIFFIVFSLIRTDFQPARHINKPRAKPICALPHNNLKEFSHTPEMAGRTYSVHRPSGYAQFLLGIVGIIRAS
jgi:hypothetical protein